MLWVYVLYEKLKGPESFYHPYFAAIGESEMLMDWTLSEKAELQDKFLVFESKKQEKTALFYYESLVEVFQAFPNFFPPDDLQREFFWSYKLVTTRSFSHGEGMVIPLADNLNHEDVYVDYLTLSREFLNRKALGIDESKDYKDFLGYISRFDGRKKFRSHLNRFEKLIDRIPDANFNVLRHIWEVDDLLSGLQSSSDEEEFVEEDESESNAEEDEDEEDEDEESSQEEPPSLVIEGKYFVMRTGSEGSFLKGSQVFNCYGRLNNTDLLNEYGFCLLPNRYDSLYVRV
jgi:glycosyltransferase involved in cell wall biosynthesis